MGSSQWMAGTTYTHHVTMKGVQPRRLMVKEYPRPLYLWPAQHLAGRIVLEYLGNLLPRYHRCPQLTIGQPF